MSSIFVENSGNFQIITLGNQGQFNPDMLTAFNTALENAASDETIQGVIVTGQEKNFSLGVDMSFFADADADSVEKFSRQSKQLLARLLQFPLPLVAAINGHAFGFGAMIAFATDYKVMRQDRGFICRAFPKSGG
jgi:enoyl-CoA hydratase/carnithine racemase